MVSAICGIFELLMFAVLYKTFGNASLTYIYLISFLLATLTGYILHIYFTFSIGLMAKKSAILFFTQALLVLALGYSIFRVLILTGLEPVFSKVGQLILTFSLNVFIGKNVTFKKIRGE